MSEQGEKLSIAGNIFDLTHEPEYRKKFFERLANIGTSPGKAVRLYCFQCSGYSYAEVRVCPCKDCPLYVLKWNRAKRKAERKGLETE